MADEAEREERVWDNVSLSSNKLNRNGGDIKVLFFHKTGLVGHLLRSRFYFILHAQALSLTFLASTFST